MKDRIKRIMDREDLTPARFADRLQINRAIISHILNGRNNPSLDVVTRILSEMNYIEPEWLLSGIGNMYKPGYDDHSPAPSPDLFTQDAIKPEEPVEASEKTHETDVKEPTNLVQPADYKQVVQEKIVQKEIAQIIVYFTDNTFKIFRP